VRGTQTTDDNDHTDTGIGGRPWSPTQPRRWRAPPRRVARDRRTSSSEGAYSSSSDPIAPPLDEGRTLTGLVPVAPEDASGLRRRDWEHRSRASSSDSTPLTKGPGSMPAFLCCYAAVTAGVGPSRAAAAPAVSTARLGEVHARRSGPPPRSSRAGGAPASGYLPSILRKECAEFAPRSTRSRAGRRHRRVVSMTARVAISVPAPRSTADRHAAAISGRTRPSCTTLAPRRLASLTRDAVVDVAVSAADRQDAQAPRARHRRASGHVPGSAIVLDDHRASIILSFPDREG